MQLLNLCTLYIHNMEEAKFVIFEGLLSNIYTVMMQGLYLPAALLSLQFSFLWSFLIESNHHSYHIAIVLLPLTYMACINLNHPLWEKAYIGNSL